MKRVLNLMKRHWISLWLAASVIGCAAFFVGAEYLTENNNLKRVAANVADTGMLFASDVLSEATNTYIKPISEGTGKSVSFEIWNYNMDAGANWYPGRLKYTLKARLYDANGNELSSFPADRSITVTRTDPSEGADTASITLDSSKLSDEIKGLVFENTGKAAHTYTVLFSGISLTEGLCVKLTAEPENRDLKPISAIVGITEQTDDITPGWRGYFNDDTSLKDYDAFNYVISGSGNRQVRLSWDSSRLTINPYFLTDMGISVQNGAGDWKYIEFTANSYDTIEVVDGQETITEKGVSRYDIQFYIADPEWDTASDRFWTVMSDNETYVKFEVPNTAG